jgi:iron complex outermembrane receptor protein
MRTTSWRRLIASRILGAAGMATIATAAQAQTPIYLAEAPVDLASLSIEELGQIQVTSVSKRAEAVREAPSAIYVITHDDIVRSGARTVPEMLRLAPNLQVHQFSASRYLITARGFSGNEEAQNFSNKLLVLIDGRSVYTPTFSGVYWDMQDVLPEDVDRIEVISGPGATLWGANAVNGVINITTRKSSETQGGLLEVGGGSRERSASLRYGGRLGEAVTYRVYARAQKIESTETLAGASQGDGWSRAQGGFRLDWTPGSGDVVTLQGDIYDGQSNDDLAGRNLLARWTRTGQGGQELQVQAYYDRAERHGVLTVDTYDIDLRHSFDLGARQTWVWGGGLRHSRYDLGRSPTLFFVPSKGDLNLSNLFVQDSVTLTASTKLTVGLKIEDDPYLDAEALPSVRLSWTPSDKAMVWAAASKAVRSATPFDRDVVEILGGIQFLTGGGTFQSEKLTAYEVGTRIQPSDKASFSVSTYYNVYDDLRTIEFDPVTFLPLHWGNGMQGHTYGLEAWGEYRVTPWWRLAGGYNRLEKRLKFKPGSSGLLGVKQAGDDPEQQASLKSSMDLGRAVTLDAAVRYVGALPDPRLPSYVELGARIAWDISDQVQLSLSGSNLLHERVQEFPNGAAIPRSVYADLRWRF